MERGTLLPCLLLGASLAFGQANNYPNGSTVANFTVTDTDGNTHDLYSYTSTGKHVMLEFFFYNCGPCRANTAKFSELYDTYGCNSADLVCLSVNTIGDPDNLVAEFSSMFGGSWNHPPAIGSGGSAAVTSAFGVQATPTFTLISPNNVMINNDIWPVPTVQTFINAFPADSNIEPAPCSLVGVNELEGSFNMELFPNPTNGPLNASFSFTAEQHVQLQLVDALGRETARWDLGRRANGQFLETLDLSGQPNGTYLLRAFTADGARASWRVVVAR